MLTHNPRATPRRQVMKKSVKFIGLDVHKKAIAVAIAEEGRDKGVRYYGQIPNTMTALDGLVRKLCDDDTVGLRFVYEAGPCGYGIYRHLKRNGLDCCVVAPSLIPKKSGDRVKNDRRDARNLARLHRAGELTSVYVPTIEDEAIRDLTRAREDARIVCRKAKQRLNSFLLRNGYDYPGKTRWSKAFFGWLSDQKMPHPAQQITLQEYINAVHEALGRISRLEGQIADFASQWRMASVVDAMQACRGVSLITAVTFVAELGDIQRFKSPRTLMAYLGLIPSEYSSGDRVKRGSITKAGNSHVRRVLVEAAWAYRFPARQSRYLLRRQQGLPDKIRQIGWNAQVRLCGRYRTLRARGKLVQTVTVAIARELTGFLWAIWNQVPQPAR